ncbi:MAG: hypothetical protein PHY93_16880, partial [Bacteriovorax sp.]|nr:hypothetical protein [Bacteriovorax sp.]
MKSYFILGIILLSLLHSYAYAEGFDFDNPNLDKPQENKNAKKNTSDVSLGSFGGLNFGVLFDERYMVTGGNAP